jgi:enoyl-CoA hydratase/carnithine racemase
METPTLHDATVELSEGVALLTFRRNDVRNALTGTALVDDILATLEWAEITPAVSVLVMTGEGAAFSSGGNVKEMQERRGIFGGTALQIQDQYRRGIQRLPLAMERAELPVIAAINGPAIGAGFDLACMCDLRLASAKAVLGETFVNLGIIPGDGGAWFLQRLVGYQRAAELTLTGRLVPAAEALQLGLVLELAEPDQLLERSLALARQLAGKPPQALRLAKRVLKLAQRGTLSDFLETCASLQAMAHHTSDHQEAVAAFLEKRDPVFTGG